MRQLAIGLIDSITNGVAAQIRLSVMLHQLRLAVAGWRQWP